MKQGVKRLVGRPRVKKARTTTPPRDAILIAAAELFAEHGFGGTTTRQIAEKVGIRQPSLFYHFKKKEQILSAIIDQSDSVWREYLVRLERRSGKAAPILYELLRHDFLYLMTEPFGIGQLIMALPELRSSPTFVGTRGRIIANYRKLIRKGMDEGDFVAADVLVTTHTVFGMGEAIWSWYRPSRSRSPEKTAEQIADLAMRALLVRPSRLVSIKKAMK